MKKIILIAVAAIVVLCVVVGGLAVGGGLLLTSGAASTGDAFMTAVKGGDYAKAYDQCAPDLQKELGSADGIKAIFENGDVKTTDYSFSSRSVQNDQGKLEGTATLSNGHSADLALSVGKIGSDWKVIGFSIKEK